MSPPLNLALGPFLITPAERPGFGRFWAVYRLLDRQEVSHAIYLGVIPQVDGEATDALLSRISDKFAILSEQR